MRLGSHCLCVSKCLPGIKLQLRKRDDRITRKNKKSRDTPRKNQNMKHRAVITKQSGRLKMSLVCRLINFNGYIFAFSYSPATPMLSDSRCLIY